eukprot:TRINITY_DN5527_c0_g1_i4.p1 TRINITY_DN5527_c0_g1~~TRINITY_DN5527_c0_g1_i4.p1  ORF type:complete len:375 (+),score=65.80 TRINITY_DN5527_c0_g1_i4:53-1126(+)
MPDHLQLHEVKVPDLNITSRLVEVKLPDLDVKLSIPSTGASLPLSAQSFAGSNRSSSCSRIEAPPRAVLSEYQKQRDWEDRAANAGGTVRVRGNRPASGNALKQAASHKVFHRPGSNHSLRQPAGSGVSTPVLLSSARSNQSSASSLQAEFLDSPELVISQVHAGSDTLHVDETQYPRLLQGAGTDRKRQSSLPCLHQNKEATGQVRTQHQDPVKAAEALLNRHLGSRAPRSSSRAPLPPRREEARPEEKMRWRLYQESLQAEENQLSERLSSLRALLDDPEKQLNSERPSHEKLAGAIEISLRGVRSRQENRPGSKVAVAEPAQPEILLDDRQRYYSQYDHGVKICAWHGSAVEAA